MNAAIAAVVLRCAGALAADAKKVEPISVRPIDLEQARKVSFTRDIKPLLVNYCVECHSAQDRKGDFETTSVASLKLPGKKAGPGVVPRKPDESSIIQYIRGQREPQMPKGNPPLSEEELHRFRQWIAAGAIDDSARASDQPSPTTPPSRNLTGGKNAEQLLIERRQQRLASLPPAAPPPKVSGPVFNPIDQFMLAQWQAAGLPEAKNPPPVCDDVTYMRRAYLDLIGAVPPAVEAHQFLFGGDPKNRREKLVEFLLARKRDYADHWMPFWEEALASANVNTQGGILTRGNYRAWLAEALFENKPYDVMVAELLDPLMPGHKKASEQDILGEKFHVSYVRNTTHTDTIQTAANVAQVFLGTSMKCASCHSHFENREWPQARFLAFAGLFAGKDLELIRCEQKTGEIIPSRFPFEIPGIRLEGLPSLDGRLHQLALLLTDPANPRFAKAIVNRLWKRYFGLGLIEPVDDFRIDRAGSNPALLEWLADDFMRHGYDLKHTIRLILTSRTYQMRYDAKLADVFDSSKPDAPRYFRSPAMRRLTAEQIIDSAEVVVNQKLVPGRRLYLNGSSTPLMRSLGRPSTRNEISTGRSDEAAVVQALEFLNGSEFQHLVYSGGVLDLITKSPDASAQVEGLYVVALQRPPTSGEARLAVDYLNSRKAAISTVQMMPRELVLMDDALPSGTKAEGSSGASSWKWSQASAAPVLSGTNSHAYAGTNSLKQLVVMAADSPVNISKTDVFFTHAWLDPANPPNRIMLQWHQVDTFYQAYWSAEPLKNDPPKGTVRFHLGPLPEMGKWVRLEIPFQRVSMETGEFDAWSYDQTGGNVHWDKTGIMQMPKSPAAQMMGDLLWTLIVSPEFQYIR